MNEYVISEHLPNDVASSLLRIVPSIYYNSVSWPCQVTLTDGTVFPRVLLRRLEKYYWDRPEYLLASQIAKIEESPHRLPGIWSNVVYAEGESGMDYFMFRVVFHNQEVVDYVSPSAIDFPDYPVGKTQIDVLRVETWRRLKQPFDREPKSGAPFYRCYFGN